MKEHPHLYIPKELENDEETITFVEEFIENENKLTEEQQRLLDLESAIATILGGGM